MQDYFEVNCIGHLFILQNISSHINFFLIDTHTKIGTESTDIAEITEVPAGCRSNRPQAVAAGDYT